MQNGGSYGEKERKLGWKKTSSSHIFPHAFVVISPPKNRYVLFCDVDDSLSDGARGGSGLPSEKKFK